MNETDELRVLISRWVEHNSEYDWEFRDWATQAGETTQGILDAAEVMSRVTRIYCLLWKSWAVRYPEGMVEEVPGKAA